MHERRRGKVRVAVLFGGQSSEHDVSLRSAETVMGALDRWNAERHSCPPASPDAR